MLLPLKYLQCFRFGRGLKKFCHDLSIIVRCFLVDKAILGFKRAHWWRKSYCLNKLAVFFLERVVFLQKSHFSKKKKKTVVYPKIIFNFTNTGLLPFSFLSKFLFPKLSSLSNSIITKYVVDFKTVYS